MTKASSSTASGAVPFNGSEFSFSDADFKQIAQFLYAETGIALTDAKKSLVYSRLVKRLRALRLASFKDYRDYIDGPGGDAEKAQMIFSLTTNVTAFFRESHHFTQLMEEALPPLIERAKMGGRVRIWSAGCSNGQEPYSIALSLLTVCPDAEKYDIKILATDIDGIVLEEARHGLYSDRNVEGVPAGIKAKYLKRVGPDEWQVSDRVKALVTFKQLNLIRPWPVKGPFDVIFCRNVVIYFDDPTKEKMWTQFAQHMAPDAYLFVGHSERVAGKSTRELATAGVTAYRRRTAAVSSVGSDVALGGATLPH
ncbi:protein-glutamate O-methyltransferase [Parvularcula sp. LCG005]|uniref:CheR family methyltransferase n=1 Tax=Parvularcula sp. LCG005 TaxID=3078805 RepID=UPI0029433CC7|nr:protein-glutamate O-methyltransferase [Parvularcula sp. LCG005]WOI52614.1 protein-glutamate O-methyltransferase [Parvularcula sp. LCG005]